MKKVFLILAVFISGISLAQNKADAIFEKYIKTIGADKASHVEAVLQKGKIKQAGQEMEFENYMSKKGAGYMKMKMMGMDLVVYAFKDGKGFKMNQSMGHDDLTEEDLKEMNKKSQNLFGDAVAYKDLEREYVGKEEKNGVKYHVVLVTKDDQKLKYYFNSKTHLIDFIEIDSPQGKIITEFKDYKDFGGIQQPTHIITKMGDQVISEMIFDEIIWNPENISEEVFEKPEY